MYGRSLATLTLNLSHKAYIKFYSKEYGYLEQETNTDPYSEKDVESQDRKLHQTLSKIFAERSMNSDQIKKLVNTNSIIKLIRDQEPQLAEQFPKDEQLEKLSLLWIAVLRSYHISTELLLRSGANVKELFRCQLYYWGDSKWSILHVLVKMYPSSWIERLVGLAMDYGADSRARDSEGLSCVHLAVLQGRVKLLEILLNKGAAVEVADNEAVTPLLAAVGADEAEQLLPLLLKHGANVKARDSNGKNVLHRLTYAKLERVDLARVLIEKGASLDDGETQRGYQPLHLAVELGKYELMNLYLDKGANVNARAIDDIFPLCIAVAGTAAHGSRTLESLLKRGASIDLRTRQGSTALHYACCYSYHKQISLLLNAGADLLLEDNEGNTPFALMQYYGIEMPSIRLMLKLLALRDVSGTKKLKDKFIINKYQDLSDYYYENCWRPLQMMKTSYIVYNCTFFELLTKCHCQILRFLRNDVFESNFRAYNVSEKFSIYAEDLERALKRVENYLDSMLEQEDVINEGFCYTMPDLVVRKIIRYIFRICESCNDRNEDY